MKLYGVGRLNLERSMRSYLRNGYTLTFKVKWSFNKPNMDQVLQIKTKPCENAFNSPRKAFMRA